MDLNGPSDGFPDEPKRAVGPPEKGAKGRKRQGPPDQPPDIYYSGSGPPEQLPEQTPQQPLDSRMGPRIDSRMDRRMDT